MKKANETPREDLLLRDVSALMHEVKRLRGAAFILNCPECGEEMAQYKRDHYKCKCGAKAQQLTIFENDEREELAYFIKKQRKALGLSHTTLARKINFISDQSLRNYEKGKGNIDLMREVVNKIIELRRGAK